jgi:Flp pilus assembly protein TadD
MFSQRVLARIAASSLVLGVTMFGCTSTRFGPAASASSTTSEARDAIGASAKAEKALAKHDYAAAVAFAEQAVAASPRDSGYRTLLGRAYLSSGRLMSANTSFSDALALDPSNGRAALSLALVQTALGQKGKAIETISANQANIAVADRGLALALAGDPQGAVSLLETVVRDGHGDAKVRQNLALSYALSGRWTDAQTMASYDLPRGEVDKRIMNWSQFARPSAASDQVASLLGFTPVIDAGQPVRLALAPAAAAPVAVAQAAPVPVPPSAEPAPVEVAAVPSPAPVVVAQAEPAPAAPVAPVEAEKPSPLIVAAAPAPTPAPVSAETAANFAGVAFAPRAEVVQKVPNLETFLAAKPQRAATFAPARVAAVQAKARVMRPAGFQRASLVKPSSSGQFVVQLGAFSAASRVETAWNQAVGRFGSLREFSPSSATFVRSTPVAATFYRLSIGGFATRPEAVQVCERIKAKGGSCFVRGHAGDAPLRWAARKSPTALASR